MVGYFRPCLLLFTAYVGVRGEEASDLRPLCVKFLALEIYMLGVHEFAT
jgi:hypothetical protein